MTTVASSLAIHDQMTSVLKTITSSMNMTVSAMEHMQAQTGQAFDSTRIQAMRRSIQQAETAIRQIPQPIDESTNRQRRFNQELRNGVSSADNLTKKVVGFIGAYAGFRAVTGLLGDGFEMFKNFEQSMANVRAITNANEGQFLALRNEAKRLGQTTVFSASEAADGMKYLGMAGWSTQSILAGMPGLLNLAAAAGEDLARTADIVSDTMTGFRLSADRASHVADVFAYTATKSNTNVAMMGETMKYVAPVAESFGASIEQTSAMIGIMANAGIKASQAGTSLRAGFLRMADPKARAEMSLEQLNVSFTDAKGNMKDINTIVNDLSVAFGRLTDGDKLAAAQRIFGVESATGWLSIIKEGPAALNEFTKALEGSGGAAAKMAEIMNNTTAGKIKLFLSEIEGIWIDFYDGLAAQGVGDAFSAVLNGLTAGLRAILPIFNEIIVAAGSVVMFFQDNWTIIEPIIWGLVAAFTSWLVLTQGQALWQGILAGRMGIMTAALVVQTLATQGLRAAWTALNTAMRMNPYIFIITVIIALITILYQLWKTNDKFAAALMRGWNLILGFFDQVPIFFARVGFGVVNAFMWMKTQSLKILEDFINACIDDINDLINLLNKIPGVSIDAVNHVQLSASAAAEEDAMKKAGESVISKMEGEAERKAAEREQKVRDMLKERQDERDKAAKEQKDAQDKIKDQTKLTDPGKGGGGTERLKGIDEVGKVKKVEGKVDISSEDLKVMRELAEMKNVQNFVTLKPSIKFGDTHVRNESDINTIVTHITEKLENDIASSVDAVYG